MRVAILGRTRMLYETMEKLLERGHEIVLIGTCRAEAEYDIKENDFRKKAEQLEVPFFCTPRINSREIVNLLKQQDAEVAVSINWLTIIGGEAIGAFKYGILNAHCGDLPKYRGNACPNWAILNGEDKYALSIHFMKADELDAGDIVVKEYYPINDDINITKIYENLESIVPELFVKAICRIEKGERNYEKQSLNVADSLRCFPRIPTDSFINWEKSSREIVRLIRASCRPFQGAFTYYNNQKLHIMEAWEQDFEVPCFVIPGQVIRIDRDSGAVWVAATDGSVRMLSIIMEGKEYRASDILSSIRIRLNYCIQEEIYILKSKVEMLEERIQRLEER